MFPSVTMGRRVSYQPMLPRNQTYLGIVHGPVQATDRYGLSRRIAGLFIRFRFGFYKRDQPDQENEKLVAKQKTPIPGQEHDDSSIQLKITGP